MGLFDGQKTDYYQRLGSRIAPIVEEKTGYVSPDRQLRRQVAGTDLSDSNAVQKTFQMLMQRDPRDAAAWLKSVQPMVEMHREQQKLQSTGGLKSQLDLLGKQYDVAGKEANARAAQFVQQAGRPKSANEMQVLLNQMADQGLANTSVYKGLETRLQESLGRRAIQPSATFSKQVSDTVDTMVEFDHLMDWTGTPIPSHLQDMDKESLSQWVAIYSKAHNEQPQAVVNAVLEGYLNPNVGMEHPDNTSMFEPIGSGTGDVPRQRQQKSQSTSPAGAGIPTRPQY